MKCYNEICRFKTEENECVGAPSSPAEGCRLYKPLTPEKDAGAKLACSDRLSAIILDWEKAADIREETANKEKNLYREGNGDGMARAYRCCADRIKRLLEEDGR